MDSGKDMARTFLAEVANTLVNGKMDGTMDLVLASGPADVAIRVNGAMEWHTAKAARLMPTALCDTMGNGWTMSQFVSE